MTVRAIVPQKPLALAKGRLAAALSPAARGALSLALLRHVCAVLQSVPAVEAVGIMSLDPMVRAGAGAWGVSSWPDPGSDLNGALAQVIAASARADQRRGLLVIAGDLAWLRAADAAALLQAAGPDAVVLAPSKDGTGTNALLVPPRAPFRPAYGDGSRAAHHRAARALGLRIIEVCRPGLAFDVDTPDDLAAVLRTGFWRGPAQK